MATSIADFKELGNGGSLAGIYTFERWIRDDGRGAFFAVLTAEGERLLVKLEPEQGPDADLQFDTWQRSRHLRHAHLLSLRDVGRAGLAGNSYIYGAFEYPDDVLASALEQGPLSEPETRDVLQATLAALRYLHGQGMVHGAVDAHHIVAVGETVKLATDALRESDDLEGPLDDVRQLGELVRSLREPEPLGEPLATIVERATAPEVRHRWTLAEIARAMDAAPMAVPVAAETAPPEVISEPAAPPVPIEVASIAATAAAPILREAAPIPREALAATREAVAIPREAVPISRETVAGAAPVREAIAPTRVTPAWVPPLPGDKAPGAREGFPKWIIAGLAILLLAILMYNLRRAPNPADVTPTTTVTAAAPAPDVLPAPPPAKTLEPSRTPAPAPVRTPAPATARKPPAVESAGAASRLTTNGEAIWRVVAFTYSSREQASAKVKHIDERWPDLHAAVFSPSGRRGYYLVVLGGRMTRAEAERLRSRAQGMGLPQDIYVQNYRE